MGRGETLSTTEPKNRKAVERLREHFGKDAVKNHPDLNVYYRPDTPPPDLRDKISVT